MSTPKAILLCMFSAGCALTPPGPPREVATQILQSLDAGKLEEASAVYRRVARDSSYRERIYPVVYEAAARRYSEGEVSSAVPLLRFLVRNYKRSAAAREALVYALFVERGNYAKADPGKTTELRDALTDFLALETEPPIWVALIETQLAIDQGQLKTARESLARFEAGWDERPEDLAIYVEDLRRYLKTH